jgi:hypothetical protein
MLACSWKRLRRPGIRGVLRKRTSVGVKTLVLSIIIVWRVVLIEALI